MKIIVLQISCTLVLLVLAVSSSAIAEEAVQVTVHSRTVTTDKTVVTVEDLATVSGGTLAQRNKISKLDVEVLPPDISSVTISRRLIEMRVALANTGNTSPAIVFGPETIEVRREVENEIAVQLEAIAKRELSKQFNLDLKDIGMSLLNGQPAKEIGRKLDRETLQGTAIFPAQLPLGQHLVRLELEDERGNHLSTNLRFRIIVSREVLVTNTSIARGTVLTAENFERTRRPMDNRNIRLASLDQLVGKVATRALQENVVMQTNFVAEQQQFEQYTVERNSIVDIVKVLGRTEIRWKNAQVLTPGRVGDAVQVMNLQSNKKVVAIVHDASTVIIR